MINKSPDLENVLKFSLGYYRFGGENEALFHVSPAGGLKLSYMALLDFTSNYDKNSKAYSFGTSLSQKKSLEKFSVPYIGLRHKAKISPLTAMLALLVFIYVLVLSTLLYRSYKKIKNTIKPDYPWTSKFALFCQVQAGLFISNNIVKRGGLHTVYVATDHCPLILATILNFKQRCNSKLVFRPHGGSIGWENEYRTLTRSIFDQIFPLSPFQRDIFVCWATQLKQVSNTSDIKLNVDPEIPSPQNLLPTPNHVCLIWLNQADLFEKNIDVTKQLISTALVEQKNIKEAIFISKNSVPSSLKKNLSSSEEYSSFIELSKNYDIEELLCNSPSVCLSSSVITRVLGFSKQLYCSSKSPVIHDRIAKNILIEKGFNITRRLSDFWEIKISSTSFINNRQIYFSEEI